MIAMCPEEGSDGKVYLRPKSPILGRSGRLLKA